MWIAGLDEAQAGIKIAERNVSNLRYADDTTLMAKCKEELKSLLMKVKEEREKNGLKLNIQETKIMASSHISSWQIDGKQWKQWETLFSWAPKSLQMVTAAMKLKDACSLEENLCKPRQSLLLKSRDNASLTKVCLVKAMFLPVVMYGSEYWAIKKAECRRTDGFKLWCWRRFFFFKKKKILERPLDCKEIKPVNRKGNWSWIFTGTTDAETPILWPPDVKSSLIWKDPDGGKDWKQEKKGTTEDEMVGWLHRLNGHEFEQAPGDGEEQKSLACCSPWSRKESEITEQLNNNF